jgi:hypothetical protein
MKTGPRDSTRGFIRLPPFSSREKVEIIPSWNRDSKEGPMNAALVYKILMLWSLMIFLSSPQFPIER